MSVTIVLLIEINLEYLKFAMYMMYIRYIYTYIYL